MTLYYYTKYKFILYLLLFIYLYLLFNKIIINLSDFYFNIIKHTFLFVKQHLENIYLFISVYTVY